MLRRLLALIAGSFVVAGTASATPIPQLMKEVERLRGVTFTQSVRQRNIDRNELPKLLQAEIRKDLPYPVDDYGLVLRSLQLVGPKDGDVMAGMLKLYESQVLAFYDPRSHVYYSIAELPAAAKSLATGDLLQDAVAVHELTHALQDQRFHAAEREESLRRDTDGELAYHALLEGEASLVMIAWTLENAGQSLDEAMKNESALAWLGSAAAADKLVDADAPRYFVEEMKFPYFDGTNLVVQGYRRGGWPMIGRMHANPPRSSREVLHPEEYFARLERADRGTAFDPTAPPGVRNVLTVEHLGEFHWRLLAGDAASGLTSDRAAVLRDGTVLADTTWDSTERAKAFEQAYVAFLRARGIEPHSAADGVRVRVAYGSDAAAIGRFLR